MVCVAFLIGLRGWLRVLLETLDISVSHSCACTCSVMAIDCACFGRVLNERTYVDFSLNETSCSIFAMVRAWKLPVLLMTIGKIWTCNLLSLCLNIRACFIGSHMLCTLLLIVSSMLLSVEYLHSY